MSTIYGVMYSEIPQKQVHPFTPTALLLLQCLLLTPLLIVIYSFGIEGHFGGKCAYAKWGFTIFIQKIARLVTDFCKYNAN